jgi:beta-glucosidase
MPTRSLRCLPLVLLPVALLASPAPTPTFLPGGENDRRAAALVATMTLDEKIGQMTQVDSGALFSREDITRYALGSILSGGSSDPADNHGAGWADLIDDCLARAEATRLRIPLLYGIDAVHGHNNVLGATLFPHNIGLGATRNAALVEEVSRLTALEMSATGARWAFAPGVIVGRDERWGRTYESFGEDPALVSLLGAAAVRGLQTGRLDAATAVLACAKHYLGDGGTTNGKDQGDTAGDEAALRRLFLPPYAAAVQAGTGSIMVTYNSWNGLKLHGHRPLLTDVLKGELGFAGFLVSDWAAIDQLPGGFKSDIEASINAGLDMVMIPHGKDGKPNTYVEFIAFLKELVQEGRVPLPRIDDAVQRILRVKFAMNLDARPRADRARLADIGRPEHRVVARRAVRESLVLLKNDRHALPLAKSARRIVLAGNGANDLGRQCGGWTISWQGTPGKVTEGGTTILEAFRQSAGPDCAVTFSADGSDVKGADAVVVVLAEDPYAEGKGDRPDLCLTDAELSLLRTARAGGAPVVLVLLSGRPLILGEALGLADAVVAAWLPGTEGRGVTDVLFGDHAPTGKLSFSWPRTMEQVPVNLGDPGYDPLFPFGFGLTYASPR